MKTTLYEILKKKLDDELIQYETFNDNTHLRILTYIEQGVVEDILVCENFAVIFRFTCDTNIPPEKINDTLELFNAFNFMIKIGKFSIHHHNDKYQIAFTTNLLLNENSEFIEAKKQNDINTKFMLSLNSALGIIDDSRDYLRQLIIEEKDVHDVIRNFFVERTNKSGKKWNDSCKMSYEGFYSKLGQDY